MFFGRFRHSRPFRTRERSFTPDASPAERLGALLQYSGEQTTSALQRLEAANSWTLTLALGAVVASFNQGLFQGSEALLVLSGSLLLTAHFAIRGMKGYINVVRYSTLSRLALAALTDGTGDPARLAHLFEAYRLYEIEWRLPIRRRDVLRKAFFELNFGYILLGLAAAALYIALTAPVTSTTAFVAGALSVLAAAEMWAFAAASPYMRRGPVESWVRRLR